MRACELCSSVLHLPVHVQSGSTATRVRQRSQRDVQGVRLRSHDADVLVYDISSARAVEISVRRWLSLAGCCVDPLS